MADALTTGIDHVGLTVRSLADSVDFFVNGLGWSEKGGKPEYPAAFVSDGMSLITLWQIADQADFAGFDRHRNIGLHHLAFKIPSSEALDSLFERIKDFKGVEIEFGPELSGSGPKRHCMIREPGGNRIEFAWDPRAR